MLNTTFVKDMPPRGHIAFLSQSGALCGGIIDWAISRGIGFCRLLSAIDPGRGPRRAAGGAGRPGAPGSTPAGTTGQLHHPRRKLASRPPRRRRFGRSPLLRYNSHHANTPDPSRSPSVACAASPLAGPGAAPSPPGRPQPLVR
ncbi:MAG: hypothetical protein IPF85_21600 [Anaerolineae bacterium]|nr:hypothetical protein [Anaerolineae bacterium]